MICIYRYSSPVGRIVLAGNCDGLTGLWFEEQKYFGSTLPETYEEIDDPDLQPVFRDAICWLDQYFQGKMPEILPKLCPEGSPFRKMIWEILLTIPYGQTRTYGEIAAIAAKRMGRDNMSAQAVGGAVGHNPISLMIPCHRVLGADGMLTGYAGGLDKKQYLLKLEGIAISLH